MKVAAIIEHEGIGYIALYPELDISSQGDDIPTVFISDHCGGTLGLQRNQEVQR